VRAWFLASLTSQALLSLAYGIALLVSNPALRWALEAVVWATIAGTGVYFVLFAVAYTGRAHLLRGKQWAVAALPAVVVVVVATNPYHHVAWRGFQVDPVAGMTTVSYAIQPAALALLTAGIAATGVGSLLLFDTVISYGPLYRGEAVAVGLSTVPPLSALVVWAHGLGPVPELNLTTTLFLPHVALDAYAFARSDMFEFHPATRRAGERAAIDDLGTPVVIVDEQGRVVTLNAAAESAFGVGKAAALTRPLAALLDEDNLAIATTADGDAVDTDGVASGDGGVVPGAGTDTVTIKREAGQSVYAVTPTPLSGAGSVHVGYTVVFQNVTAERRREQRLNVLNRVLRHNLRNDMTVVTGFTQAAAERVDDPETASMLDRATDAADDLVELGQKAREVERLLDRENHAERVVLADTVERVVADHMDTNPSATVTVAAGDVAARTDPTVLETVVGEPVENALVHAGPEPTVELVVQRRADAVAVTVTDDGPGIPEHERAAIDAGVESALEHGSGLGLWLANWGATSLGGRLVLDSNGGTTATVELPGSGESDRE
jgi:signal transduction histidine kinase